ncbi:amidohydrolase family protein [Conexibacter sp. CPCC 206217]|uniref:amidohydrolase family protein n=1 Tax=Conexibacter sp. CPCC 206217 TaxID=3064574 RepID=UPI002722CEEB|nr:amidohydrolase family protein [Conexibacter sp. CPCC 206217]MDO8209733.1 amidohydrolase family protein [Conexibacter sp. CPCC 206217]
MSVSVRHADQLVRFPAARTPYLRHDRAAEIESGAGELTIADGVVAGFEADRDADVVIDASGGAVVPGFVDCHTHLPFAGWRAQEYAQKVAGVAYEQIARAGGGIAASAAALRAAGDEDVLRQAGAIRAEMLAHGTTTFEAKTGYGLSPEQELRAVRLARSLGADVVTGLFAHAVPPGFDADAWMESAEQLARDADVDALDVYVESMAFRNADLERLGEIARQRGLPLRAHVEQFNSNRSVPVAIAAGARSVDHLACLHPDDRGELAASECAAVLLPGAEFLGDERVAPGRALADAGAICVLATDCNPGTSTVVSMPLVIGLAVRRYRWTVQEALLASTLNAAWVLGLERERGSLDVGKRGDAVVLDGPIEQLPYRFGRNPVAVVIRGGEIVWVRPDQSWRVTPR